MRSEIDGGPRGDTVTVPSLFRVYATEDPSQAGADGSFRLGNSQHLIPPLASEAQVKFSPPFGTAVAGDPRLTRISSESRQKYGKAKP
jgi:hypothetical protein